MSDPVWLTVDAKAHATTLRLAGPWRLARLADIATRHAALRLPDAVTVDASGLEQIDSAGALVLLDLLEQAGARDVRWQGLAPAHARIVQAVGQSRVPASAAVHAHHPGWVAQLGEAIFRLDELFHGHISFFGRTVAALGSIVARPARLRWRELTVQVEQTGLNAIPVVLLVTFLIGIVVAYLLGLQATKYGANIFVVDGVAIGATREFAPIIVAVVVAGRSGAAFTAQLGSMRLNEETDAIQTLGLDPMQVLVVPRVLALLVTMPLLVFVGDLASLGGAMTIAGPMLDITPTTFLDRLRSELELRHAIVGLAKAPIFAFVIAVIGTRMGMTVARDTRALGIATTSTVVQSIVAVILIDAAAAIVLEALDL
jgi:phospholipid/cholesterol/gamma-HCH transport system permease protein